MNYLSVIITNEDIEISTSNQLYSALETCIEITTYFSAISADIPHGGGITIKSLNASLYTESRKIQSVQLGNLSVPGIKENTIGGLKSELIEQIESSVPGTNQYNKIINYYVSV